MKQAKIYEKRLLLCAVKSKEYGHRTPGNKRHTQIWRRHTCIHTLSVVHEKNDQRHREEEQGGNQPEYTNGHTVEL